jgi:photoactive yellow protein
MNVLTPVRFDGDDTAERLQQLSREELDALDYGVVEMDHGCEVLRYNATESRHAGLPPERVIGRHFFRDVAPCSNNRHVAQRYGAATLDDTIAYTFALRMKPVPVTLRMLKPAGSTRMYLLVRWA